jgi:tetratricopeptide (TPR) repeat protein
LGQTLIDLADIAESRGESERAQGLLREAESHFLRSLEVDQEDVTAHANLAIVYGRLDETELAAKHSDLQLRYKMDDSAGSQAIPVARRQYPAADHAAEPLVIYSLHREGAPVRSEPVKE